MHKNSVTGPHSALQVAKKLWSHMVSDPIGSFLMISYAFSGSIKVLAPRTLQAMFQNGHPLWLWRTAGLMEVAVANGLFCEHHTRAISMLSSIFLGGVIYTIAVFPQDLPMFLTESSLFRPIVRAATFLPPLAFAAMMGYHQMKSISIGTKKWTMTALLRKIVVPSVIGMTLGAIGGHVFSTKAKST